MLNSTTTNRLRADFDSRRRSSTGRLSSVVGSSNKLRQGKKRDLKRNRIKFQIVPQTLFFTNNKNAAILQFYYLYLLHTLCLSSSHAITIQVHRIYDEVDGSPSKDDEDKSDSPQKLTNYTQNFNDANAQESNHSDTTSRQRSLDLPSDRNYRGNSASKQKNRSSRRKSSVGYSIAKRGE